MGHPWHDWMLLINKEYVPNPFSKSEKVIFRREDDIELEPIPVENRPTTWVGLVNRHIEQVQRAVEEIAPNPPAPAPLTGLRHAAATRADAEVATQIAQARQRVFGERLTRTRLPNGRTVRWSEVLQEWCYE